ncbi:MAG: ferritin-like domain-containing protein [Actinomycetota bacterium]
MDSPEISTAPAAVATGSAVAASGMQRRLLGAGLLGIAGSLLSGTIARASAPTTTTATAPTTTAAPPKRPTADDAVLLAFAQTVELSAQALFDQALTASALDENSRTVFAVIHDAHQSYGQTLSAMLGKTAPGSSDPAIVATYSDVFAGASLPALLEAALLIENTAVATHTELLGELKGTDGAKLIGSIVTMEARHAVVLADLAGLTELDALLVNDAAALKPTEG